MPAPHSSFFIKPVQTISLPGWCYFFITQLFQLNSRMTVEQQVLADDAAFKDPSGKLHAIVTGNLDKLKTYTDNERELVVSGEFFKSILDCLIKSRIDICTKLNKEGIPTLLSQASRYNSFLLNYFLIAWAKQTAGRCAATKEGRDALENKLKSVLTGDVEEIKKITPAEMSLLEKNRFFEEINYALKVTDTPEAKEKLIRPLLSHYYVKRYHAHQEYTGFLGSWARPFGARSRKEELTAIEQWFKNPNLPTPLQEDVFQHGDLYQIVVRNAC